jgi:CRP-like cAMP-binding protein
LRGGKEAMKRIEPKRAWPGRNGILAALPPDDYERLLPHLEPFPLPANWIVHVAGTRERHVYFPTAGIVSRYHTTEGGASAGFAVTGREGMIGVASFLGGASTPSQAEVLCAGFSFRVETDRLASAFEQKGALARLMLRYTQALIAQTGQIAVCNRHHSLEQQLARWILSCLDRLPSNELAMTQSRIADMLGVRREGVTEAAGRLQLAGLIQCRRGRIVVPDRRRLEQSACECYAVVAREYDRLLRCDMPSTVARATGATDGSGNRHGETNGSVHAP